MRIEYHRTLLADRVRNDAFFAALKATIVPGKSIVADIGCGTGVLGFMAARLGAKRVFMLEAGEIVSVTRKLARHNCIRNIEIVPAHSTEVTPPEPVDIVVSETLGNYAFEENIIETLNDAHARYLKPGGVLLPDRVRQFVAPVIDGTYFRELAVWSSVGFGLDFEPAKTTSLNNIYVRKFKSEQLIDHGRSPILWDDVKLGAGAKVARNGQARWAVAAPATIYGLALWWDARLAGDFTLSTAPEAAPTHWEQLYLPVLEPIVVDVGAHIDVQLKSKSTYARGTDVSWTVTAFDAKNRVLNRQAMDLKKGYIA